jgi:anaerobic selenocysteine-containing dehydrogenase
MGFTEEFFNGDLEAGYAYELQPSGVTLEQLKNSDGGISLPAKPTYEKHAKLSKEGTPRGFATPSKKVELYCHPFATNGIPAMPEYIEPALSPVSRPDIAAEFPLILTNAKNTNFVHSQHRAVVGLRKTLPEPTADIHPETALHYGIKNKQWMTVESPRGAIKVKARVTTNIVAGAVCIQHGWWQGCKELELPGYNPFEVNGANAAMLIGTDYADPVSGSLPHRSYLCRVKFAE